MRVYPKASNNPLRFRAATAVDRVLEQPVEELFESVEENLP